MNTTSVIASAVFVIVGLAFIIMGFNGLFFRSQLSVILTVSGIVLITTAVSYLKSKPQELEEHLEGSWRCVKCKALNLLDDRVCYDCGNPALNTSKNTLSAREFPEQ